MTLSVQQICWSSGQHFMISACWTSYIDLVFLYESLWIIISPVGFFYLLRIGYLNDRAKRRPNRNVSLVFFRKQLKTLICITLTKALRVNDWRRAVSGISLLSKKLRSSKYITSQ